MNSQDISSKAKEFSNFSSFNKRYPFSLQQLICDGVRNLRGNVVCRFMYYYTTICVSVNRSAPSFNLRKHRTAENGYRCDEYLTISFHDHIDWDPKYRLPQVTQYQLLLCLGMLKSAESPYGITTYKNPSPFYPRDPETVYYVRPLCDCAIGADQLKALYLHGTMTIEEMWACAQQAAGNC